MCGFVGLRDLKLGDRQLISGVGGAIAVLRHRGPDNVSTVLDDKNRIALGHTRLSIIDVTSAANQPMVSRNGLYTIAFNGEIYNYRDLYERFCPKDGSVNGKSDTAILLYLYGRFKERCLELLDGMFSFAVIDTKGKKIFLARDRFGEKPLYWFAANGRFAFASEIKGLRKVLYNVDSYIEDDIDSDAVALYHVIGSIPSPYTIYRSIRSLKAGCCLNYEFSGALTIKRYWSPVTIAVPDSANQIKDNEAQELTLEKLQRAVKSRMVSDVPVGIFLSGGYDSNSILGLCSVNGLLPSKSLCIDFEEDAYSEYKVARASGEHYGIEVDRHVINEAGFLAGLDEYFVSMDQPTIDGYNTFFMARVAHGFNIKVWLTGTGGDESFGGYPSFERLKKLSMLARVLQMAHLEKLIGPASDYLQENLRLSRLLHLAQLGDPSMRAYQCCRNSIPLYNMLKMIAHDRRRDLAFFAATLDAIYPAVPSGMDDFQKSSIYEASVYMGSQLLRDIDNFSMAHSLELRAPFLDHDLYQFVLSLPESIKWKDGRFKPLLADCMKQYLPAFIKSQSKRGFTFPVEKWLLKGMKGSFEEIVFDSKNKDLWEMSVISRMWQAFKEGRVHWSVIWNIYAMGRWYHEHK